MRVAFDGRSLATPALRGWDRYTIGLVEALVRAGVQVTLVHRVGAPPRDQHVAGLGCDIRALPDRGGMWWEQVAVPQALRRGEFDLYHAPAEHGIPVLSRRPTVLTVHSVTMHSYADLIHRGLLKGELSHYLGSDAIRSRWAPANIYWHLQVHRARHLFTPSAFTRDEVVRFLRIPPKRVTVTPLATHKQFQQPRKTTEARTAALERLGVQPPYLLYVGGYEPHKNVEGLLRAFVTVHRERSDLSMVLVGTKGLPAQLPETAGALGLSGRRVVVFLVDLTDELTDLYDAAELFVTLSWRESFCLPALEAMARGLPVVASEWGATPEVVGNAGVLVDPRDETTAAQAMLELLDTKNRDGLCDRARERAARFTWEATARETLRVYERLLSG